MTGREVLTEECGRVLLITLNRPHVLNGVDSAMTQQLGAALTLLEDSDELRAAVINGSGRAFCAGLDMKAVAAGETIEATRHPAWGFAGITTRVLDKPLIAAVNGDAIGGGFEIALSCDLIIASSTARFALPEVKHGLFAAGGGVYRLAQQLPTKIAHEMLLTGRMISAGEAADHGLVNKMVTPAHVLNYALQVAERIALNAPLAVQATKRLAHAALTLTPTDPRAIQISNDSATQIFTSHDASEGINAFTQQRTPIFIGQ